MKVPGGPHPCCHVQNSLVTVCAVSCPLRPCCCCWNTALPSPLHGELLCTPMHSALLFILEEACGVGGSLWPRLLPSDLPTPAAFPSALLHHTGVSLKKKKSQLTGKLQCRKLTSKLNSSCGFWAGVGVKESKK